MSAAETIAKAIEKLEDARGAATGGEWYSDSHIGGDGSVVMADGVRQAHLPGHMEDHEGNADLIVTLHRTIDAQLGMLRGVLRVHQEVVGLDFDNEEVWPIPAWALKLAEAIIGGDR